MTFKICHLDTEMSWRGGEQQLLYLARGLRAAGDINLIAVRSGSALAARAEGEGFEVLNLKPFFEWDPIAALVLRKKLFRGGYDLLHAHTAHAAALGALATLGTKIPLLISRRVDFHLSPNPLTHWKYRRAAKILAVSLAIQEILIQDGLSQERIAVVHSGIDVDLLQKTALLETRKNLGLPLSGILIGQVAALAPHKDPLNFLQAIAILKQENSDIHGVMVGSGPMEKEVRREIERRNLSKSVSLLGFRRDAHQIIRNLNVCVLSSHLEGLGTSILDAMALGVPVVATRAGGIPEMIDDGVSGLLVSPKNSRELAMAISRVLQNDSLRETLKKGGHEKVKNFDVRSMVESIRATYEQILKPAATKKGSLFGNTHPH